MFYFFIVPYSGWFFIRFRKFFMSQKNQLHIAAKKISRLESIRSLTDTVDTRRSDTTDIRTTYNEIELCADTSV